MLLSTPLSLLLSISTLNGADDVIVERQFNAVIIQNGLKVEVEGSGPEAYVVEVDAWLVPPREADGKKMSCRFWTKTAVCSSACHFLRRASMAQEAIENSPPEKKCGNSKSKCPRKPLRAFSGSKWP